MIEFIKKNSHKNLILFVHGFRGGKDTWKNKESGYFYDFLKELPIVEQHFDIATFEYFSTFTNIYASTKSAAGWVMSLFPSVAKKSKRNIAVEQISDLLRTQIRFKLKSYDQIVVIAHSMGGLVTKASIVKDHEEGVQPKIKLFISLAVPHLGADLATFGKLISPNVQVHDLAPLSDLCPQLNDQWVKMAVKPKIKYFYGTYDDIVQENSAIGTDNVKQDIVVCDEDHSSICKPKGADAIVPVAVGTFLEELIHGAPEEKILEVKKLQDSNQFDDEYFVLKLLLADVHNASVTHSKEHFLNAEYARKLFSSEADQRKFGDLYSRIRTLYQDSFDEYIGNGGGNSGKLISSIYDKIVREDSAYLKSAIPLIHALHKKGMLHQLANELEENIWWSENRSIAALESLTRKVEATSK